MWKSGLIIGAVVFGLVAVATMLMPICASCVALFAGLLAGYLAGVFEKPRELNQAVKAGVVAGGIGGLGAILGGVMGGLGNALVFGMVGPEQYSQMITLCGVPSMTQVTTGELYLITLGTPICIGLFNIVLMAGLGALGAVIWRKQNMPGPVVLP